MSLNLFNKNYLQLEKEFEDKLLTINKGKSVYNEFGEKINNIGSQYLKSYIDCEQEEEFTSDSDLSIVENIELQACTMNYLNKINKEKYNKKDINFYLYRFWPHDTKYGLSMNLGTLFDSNIKRKDLLIYLDFFGYGYNEHQFFKQYFLKKIKIPNNIIENSKDWYMNITLITGSTGDFSLSLDSPILVINFYRYNKNLNSNFYNNIINEFYYNEIKDFVFNPSLWIDKEDEICSYFYPLLSINNNNNSKKIHINKNNSFLLKRNNEDKLLYIDNDNNWNIDFSNSKIKPGSTELQVSGYMIW